MQATSALDAGSKALVQKALERMDAGRFALVMARLDEGCALPAPADVMSFLAGKERAGCGERGISTGGT